MKRIVEFALKSGEQVLVEVEERQVDIGIERASLPAAVATEAQNTFESALEKIRPLAETVVEKLRDLEGPTGIEVEFGIKLSAESGIILAAASAEANFSIKLSWTRDHEPHRGS